MKKTAGFGLKSLLAAAAALPLLAPAADAQNVKYIMLFIGDGMQLETEIAASRYLTGRDYELSWHKLPYQSNVAHWDVTTYEKFAGKGSYDPKAIFNVHGYDVTKGGRLPYPLQRGGFLDSYFLQMPKPYATDSASAATAWATGYKTDDGNLAWLPGDPADGSLKTIAEILREKKGFAIGVTSTVPFSHATPASHVSHNVSRNNYLAIADEILFKTKPEVVIGAGHPGWARNSAKTNGAYISDATYNLFKSGAFISQYIFAERQAGKDGAAALMAAAEAAARQGKKLFGLFGGVNGHVESAEPKHSPGSPEVKNPTIENPMMKDQVLAAIKVLSQDRDGFFAMFEQGDIDWAAHANDYARMVGTTWDMHVAVQAVIDYVNQEGDDMTWDNTLLLVTSDHGNSYLRLNRPKAPGKGELPKQVEGVCPDNVSAKCPNYPDGEVSFRTTNHTNELVRLYGIGKGAESFAKWEGVWYPCTNIIDNTQLFHMMLEAAGVQVESPLKFTADRGACN